MGCGPLPSLVDLTETLDPPFNHLDIGCFQAVACIMDSAPVSKKTFRILFNTCCESRGLSDLKYTGKIISNPPLEVSNIISVLMLHYSKYENKASTQIKARPRV